MRIAEFKDSLPEFARDQRLNLPAVLSEEGAPGLNQRQIWSIALAVAYAIRHAELIAVVQADALTHLPPESVEAAKAASTIMAMNNVYYRFTHLAEHEALSQLPARLRMNVIGKPGVEKVDFELMSLAVSAVEGCGKCIQSHVHELEKSGLSLEGIQSSVRIAAVLNAAAQARVIASLA